MGNNIIIVGSGLGGLLCGAILSKNGYNVCILEKNQQIGGCLQTYQKDGAFFDTGVHYLGGLAEGQNLYQIFSYIGLLSKVRLERLDMDKFDLFLFGDDPKQYAYAQTYEKFIDTLASDFPHEREGIKTYCNKIKYLCERFPLYNLRYGDFMDKLDLLNINARDAINSCVSDPFLQNLLAGNNSLYAGVAEKTPFYIHALILNSYIESSWRCAGGGIQIAQGLANTIKSNGGKIIVKASVNKIITEHGKATKVITTDGREFTGDYFISDLHPVVTIAMTQTDVFRKAYIHRINSIENTIGAFTLNVAFKEKSFPAINSNLYCFSTKNVWAGVNYATNEWPESFALFSSSHDQRYMHSASLLSYMRISELSRWENTYNTIYEPASRGSDYEEFKLLKAEKLIDMADKKVPGFKKAIKSFHTVTPLTYRDYLGTPGGSLYGILRDYREPLKTFIPARTKIPNLLLTGQNLNVHGILGVSVSSIITCGELMGVEPLLEKIRNA